MLNEVSWSNLTVNRKRQTLAYVLIIMIREHMHLHKSASSLLS